MPSLHATTGTAQVPEVSTVYRGAVHLLAPPARTFKLLDVRQGEEGTGSLQSQCFSKSYFNWKDYPFPLLA